jgi:hypothetical protein
LVADQCVGINEHTDNVSGFTVFPNPAGDIVYVQAQVDERVVLEISDASGRIVYSSRLQLTANTSVPVTCLTVRM